VAILFAFVAIKGHLLAITLVFVAFHGHLLAMHDSLMAIIIF